MISGLWPSLFFEKCLALITAVFPHSMVTFVKHPDLELAATPYIVQPCRLSQAQDA